LGGGGHRVGYGVRFGVSQGNEVGEIGSWVGWGGWAGRWDRRLGLGRGGVNAAPSGWDTGLAVGN
jgi:hypothetical protein